MIFLPRRGEKRTNLTIRASGKRTKEVVEVSGELGTEEFNNFVKAILSNEK